VGARRDLRGSREVAGRSVRVARIPAVPVEIATPVSAELRKEILAIVQEFGVRESEVPFTLRSGELSSHFIDGKAALARGEHLRKACAAMVGEVGALGVEFDAVGGLTMGADQFAHGIAALFGKEWFVVRKERKGRGTNELIEGATLGPGSRVLLVDDVVTTGGSIEQAYGEVLESGATVAAAATLVDRGESARAFFESRGVPYVPLVTYVDLGIPPVGAASI